MAEDETKTEEAVKDATLMAKSMDWSKKNSWKYFGAMFMEKKDGQQAVSLTRLLALVCFANLLYKWNIDVGTVPDTLLYTFWGLLGGKTAESMVALWKGHKGQ